MAAIVKSVEKFSIAMSAGTASVSQALGEGQTTANCIPFRTVRVTTPDPVGVDLPHYLVDVSFSGPNVVVERGSATATAIVVEVSVVEFDTTVSNTRVEQGTFTIASANPTVTIDSRNGNGNLDLTKAFPYITWLAPNSDTWGGARVFAEWQPGDTTGVTLDIDRVTTGVGDVTGHWYVVQSDEFTVQSKQLFASGAVSDSETLDTSVTLSETFLVGGIKTNTNKDNARGTAEYRLSTTAVSFHRSSTADYIQGTPYVVSMAASCGNVQHGQIAAQAATASETVALGTSVTRSRSVVMPLGLSITGGSFTGANNSDVPDVFCAWDFSNNGTPSDGHIRVQHGVTGGESGQNLSWQVIEWELTGGAPPATPRRVMVIS